MNRKSIIFIILLVFIGFFNFVNIVKGTNDLKTNKEIYFIDEEIRITASWELNYINNIELAYVQIHIYNISNDLLWSSPEYYEKGSFERNWTVRIQDLNILHENISQILDVKLQHSYEDLLNQENSFKTFLEIVKVEIIKRDISCQTIDLKDFLNYGEILSFKAKFYENYSDHILNLKNQIILFEIMIKNSIIFLNHYNTSQSGMVEVLYPAHLEPGKYELKFSLKNNAVFNDYELSKELLVKKATIIIEIINSTKKLGEETNFKLKMKAYYIYNNTRKPLANHSITLIIHSSGSLKYKKVYTTDESGQLNMELSVDFLNITKKDESLTIYIIINGSDYLERQTKSLNLTINHTELDYFLRLPTFSVVSILTIIFFVFSLILFNNKSSKQRILEEICIKY